MLEETLQSSALWQKFELHKERCNKSQDILINSLFISKSEITQDLLKLFTEKEIFELLNLVKDVIGNTAWVSNSALKFFTTLVGLQKKIKGNAEDVVAQMIASEFVSESTLSPHFLLKYPTDDLFNSLFNEIEYNHYHQKSFARLVPPKTSATIVLVSGVLNEIYKQAAFERGVAYLKEKAGQKYVVAKVHGLKNCEINAQLIGEQLKEYIKNNPNEKLWIMAYSKGGLDALHFLKNNKKFSEKHILGLTTVASPLMGADQIDDHKFIRIISSLEKKYDSLFKSKKTDSFIREILGQEVRKSLAATKQERWFKKNHSKLPSNLFYSSLALDSGFFESHIGMMITKLLIPAAGSSNDGLVDVKRAHFPDYFKSIKLGTIRGHHLIGARSSSFRQEALIESMVIFHKKLGLIS